MLSLLTWNAQGLTKRKLNDPDFLHLVNKHDILLLTETWCRHDSDIDIDGFTSYPVHRDNVRSTARRASGGIVAYIKDCFLSPVTVLKHYIPPLNASSHGWNHVDLFDVILSDISVLKTDFPGADYVICGDMNGRTGTLPDYIMNDYSSYLPLPDDYDEDRTAWY